MEDTSHLSELQSLSETDMLGSNSTNDAASEEGGSERSHPGSSRTSFRAYSERWYILIMFAIINVMQTAVYNTFGAITTSSVLAFNLTQTDIALLPNWANIVYFFSIGPFVHLINTKGLRMPVLLTAAFVWAGAAVRTLHFGDNYRIFLHMGQFLNSFAGPVTFFACTALSSIWFPPAERLVATSVAFLIGNFGGALAFLIGPLFVKWFASDLTDAASVRTGITSLLTFEYLLASVLLVTVIYSFRSKPPTPPSFTATLERISLRPALATIFASRDCWIAILSYSLTSGMWGGWLSILSWVLRERVTELEVGWLGFASSLSGALSGVIVSAIMSRFQNHGRHYIIFSLSICCILVTWHVVTYNLFPALFTQFGVWLCIIGTSAALISSQPILWEQCCELAYPAPESIVSAVLSVGNSFVSAVLLIIAMAPSLGTAWMDWALLATFWISVPLMLFYRPVSRRSALDL